MRSSPSDNFPAQQEALIVKCPGRNRGQRLLPSCLIVSLLLPVLFGCTPSPEAPCPTDKELITFFHTNSSDFAGLADDMTDQKLLDHLGISKVKVLSTDPMAAYFEVWSKDFPGPGGCYKGYAYFERPPDKLVHSIDTVTFPGTAEEKQLHRRIGQTWYIYYQSFN